MEWDRRAIEVCEALQTAGFEACLVGGCVRDFLRGVPPQDYDAATSALPHQILQVFPGVPVLETGMKHGTVTLLFEGLPLEVTTYRVDGDYTDGRRPDGVRFTPSLAEDLARRDFTVNALAWSPRGGIVDLFDGISDLKAGILRCVGDPERRFAEDALRILRGMRFASVLGFSLENATKSAMIALKDRLKCVSAERIFAETEKMLCGKNAAFVLSDFSPVLAEIIPELAPTFGFDQHSPHHCYDIFTHLVQTVAAVPPKPALRWAALFHDIGKPETFSLSADGVGHFYGHAPHSAALAEKILTRLRCSNALKAQTVALIRHHDGPLTPDPALIRRKMNVLGEEGFFDLLSLVRADNAAQAPHLSHRQAVYEQVEALAREILEEHQCFSLKDLAVNGHDLMALGYSGPALGAALEGLLAAVLDGTCENEKESLLRMLNP